MQTHKSRRTVLHLVAGGVAATMAAPAAADPVYGLIETHRTARAAHSAALAEQVTFTDWNVEAPCHAEMDAFNELIATAPKTLGGLRAWAAYLGEISDSGEAWMFEEEDPMLVAIFAEALGNLAAT